MGTSIQQRVSINSGHVCTVVGCTRRRHGASPLWCKHHVDMKRRYGVPTGRRWHLKEFEPQVRAVRGVLRANRGHRGATLALEWIERRFRTAGDAEIQTEADSHLARLHRRGVKPIDVLVLAAAVYSFAKANEHHLPLGDPLVYALGTLVIHLRPLDRRSEPSATARESIGRELMEALFPVLFKLHEAIHRNAGRKDDLRAAMEEPLKPARPRKVPETIAVAPPPAPNASLAPVAPGVRHTAAFVRTDH